MKFLARLKWQRLIGLLGIGSLGQSTLSMMKTPLQIICVYIHENVSNAYWR